MTDNEDFNEFDDNTDDNSGIKDFRAAKKEAATAAREAAASRAEADAAKRELAFLRAGIDPDSQTAKRISKVHEGDWTADALKATGADFGWITPEEPAVPADELAAHDRFAAANNGHVDGITAGDEFMSAVQKVAGDWRNSEAGKAVVMEQLRKAGIQIDDSEPSPWTEKHGRFDRGGVERLGTKNVF